MMSLIQSIPRVSPTASALAMSDPIRAAMMPIRDGEPDGDVLAAGVHQPAQRPDDEPDDDGADDESEQVVSLKVGSDPGVVWLAVQHDAGHGAGHAVQELDMRRHQSAELVEAGRLQARDEVVGAARSSASCTPSSLVSAWATWATLPTSVSIST